MKPDEFWNYSVFEIGDMMDAYENRMILERKQSIEQDYNLADAIVSRLFTEKEENIINPWDTYPTLFKQELEQHKKYQEESEFEKFKEKRRRFAADHNRDRR